MTSTYSDSYKLELQETGANANTWGNNTNTNLETVDAFTAGYISKSVAGSANVTLTSNNADPSAEASNKVIELTGTLTGNIHVFIPAVENYYYIFNNTAGSFSLDIAPTGHGANSVQIVQGSHTILYCKNGNEVVDLFSNSLGNLSIKNTLTVNNSVFTAANGAIDATAYSGNGSSLTGVSSIPSGTTALFFQGSAPTGWTQNTDASINSTTLRVVTGTGGGTGGADNFSTVFSPSKSTSPGNIVFDSLSISADSSGLSLGSTTLSTPQLPSHSHPGTKSARTIRGGPNGRPGLNATSSTGSTGGGGGHTHAISGTASVSGNATCSTSLTVSNMNIKFANVIACSKD
tara:strand:- start:157 stop:1197 length:1041 start_codon:yes stop_codon:yes gene_type:complete